LGKRIDDDVQVALPGGATTFAVVAVSYALKPPERS
jgi:transcription elongation GreA/GreB family factor